MGYCKDRAFEVLKKISFERIAGTEKELECANILLEECKKRNMYIYSYHYSKKTLSLHP